MAYFSAGKGRVFKQCATKGRVLDTLKCAREGKGMDFGQNFVPVRVGVRKLCVKKGRVSGVPS